MEILTYHQILANDYPLFINEYLDCPLLSRLKGVGLFCGIDYTSLYTPKYFYSRLDHSIGVALIIWHFTKDKKQTIAGLLHDVSTPAFSHVIDYLNKDYMMQESTEDLNSYLIKKDKQLAKLLLKDHLTYEDVCDYKQYPIADNKMPMLSADRLEYMFATGLIVKQAWDLNFIKEVYDNLTIQNNEFNVNELGFTSMQLAISYCQKCLKITQLYIEKENKLALQLLATLIEEAIKLTIISENDLYNLSEIEIIDKMKLVTNPEFKRLFNSFISIKEVGQSINLVDSLFIIKISVKRRYIDPIINGQRLSIVSKEINDMITKYLNDRDNQYIYIK